METLLIILGALFILAGIAGAFLPLIPGPPLSYIGLLIVHFTKGGLFSLTFLLIWLVICIVVVTLDGFVPVEGARRMGGSKKGIYGALVGAIAGLYFFHRLESSSPLLQVLLSERCLQEEVPDPH